MSIQLVLNKSAQHGVPVKVFTKDIEQEAIQQLHNLAQLEFVHHHIAVMPDVHVGKGATVGSVIPTKDAIIPAAVGVDIGCGICAVKTDLKIKPNIQKRLKEIVGDIEKRVPVGFKHHKRAQDEGFMPEGYKVGSMEVVSSENQSALRQLGTLGGGNHFIEIQRVSVSLWAYI